MSSKPPKEGGQRWTIGPGSLFQQRSDSGIQRKIISTILFFLSLPKPHNYEGWNVDELVNHKHSLTREWDPEILELLYLGQQLTPSQDRTIFLFRAENHGLRPGGADTHTDSFTLSALQSFLQKEIFCRIFFAESTTSPAVISHIRLHFLKRIWHIWLMCYSGPAKVTAKCEKYLSDHWCFTKRTGGSGATGGNQQPAIHWLYLGKMWLHVFIVEDIVSSVMVQ